MKKESYYKLTIEDFSAPSFTSCSKSYYGMLNDISGLLETLSKDDKWKNSFLETQEAFKAFMNGDTEVHHNILYENLKFLEPVNLIGSLTYTENNKQWKHINAWEQPYYMRFSKAKIQHLWVVCQNEYMRVLKTNITGLQYSSDKKRWVDIKGGFWGFPHMLEFSEGNVYNRLAVEDKGFETLEAAKADFENFLVLPDTDFTEFCNDIFGDG